MAIKPNKIKVEPKQVEAKETLLADIGLKTLPPQRAQRSMRMVGEAFFFTLAALIITSSWSMQESGVFSIFLSSAALTGRFNYLMNENRDNIWMHKKSSLTSNRVTALGILALFAGMMLAYVLAAVVLGEAHTGEAFRFALSTAHIGDDTIASRRFGDFGSLIGHNLAVLGSFAVLALVYRSFGALLALAWNACVWGVVLTLLIARGFTGAGPVVIPVAVLALLPHLVLEALAYVLGSLAGIFLSKALAKYEIDTKEFQKVARAAVSLLGVAIVLLTLAAVIEHSFPDQLLSLLRAH